MTYREIPVSLGGIVATVRPPDYRDDELQTPNELGRYGEDELFYNGREVYAVVDFGYAGKVFFTDTYVDWYGDGGFSPQDVLPRILVKALAKM